MARGMQTRWHGAALAATALLLAACGGGDDAPEAAGPAPASDAAGGAGEPAVPAEATLVEVTAARPFSGGTDILATGAARRERELDLAFPIGGIVREVAFREGDTVARGALVAAIDPTVVDARIAQAQEQARAAGASVDSARAQAGRAGADVQRAAAALAQAEADLAQARSDLARDQTLADRGFVSGARLETRQTRLQVAEAAARAARMGVRAAEAGAAAAGAGVGQASAGAGAARAGVSAAAFDRARSRLFASAEGVVLSRLVEPGEVVAPGQPVMVIADETSALIVRAPVSDRDVARIRRGDPARVTFQALGLMVPGEVVRVGERADPRTGAFDVDVRIAPQSAIRTGFFAEVRVLGTAGDLAPADRQLVPAAALIEARDGGATLYVMNRERTRARRVRVGFHGFSGEEALVSGLAPATLVITRGGGFVRDGAPIEVVATSGSVAP